MALISKPLQNIGNSITSAPWQGAEEVDLPHLNGLVEKPSTVKSKVVDSATGTFSAGSLGDGKGNTV